MGRLGVFIGSITSRCSGKSPRSFDRTQESGGNRAEVFYKAVELEQWKAWISFKNQCVLKTEHFLNPL